MKRTKNTTIFAVSMASILGLSGGAFAGPFILDQTDADDHGGATSTENVDGWFYMQRVLENLAPGVTNGFQTVVQLGGSSTALTAAQSAFSFSTLNSGGWNWVNIDGDAAITDFFSGVGTFNINNVGIIQLDSGSNVTGGSVTSEQAILTSNANLIDGFLGAGGGLHSMANNYGFLSALLPDLQDLSTGGSGLFLTPQGQAAFPGLTDSDLSAGPFHGTWGGDLSGLTVLFSDALGTPVGIGSEGGSITDPGGPNGIPEPATLALFGAALAGLGAMRRRKV